MGERVAHPVDAAALPGGAEDAGDRRLEPLMGIGDDELHALEAALDQALEKGRPEGLGFGGADVQADDLAPPLGAAGHGDYRGDGDGEGNARHRFEGKPERPPSRWRR
jgi:hypothetical protein